MHEHHSREAEDAEQCQRSRAVMINSDRTMFWFLMDRLDAAAQHSPTVATLRMIGTNRSNLHQNAALRS